jgi:hypothetical protein
MPFIHGVPPSFRASSTCDAVSHGAIGPKMLAEDSGEEHRLFAVSTRVPCADAGPPGKMVANTGGSKNSN